MGHKRRRKGGEEGGEEKEVRLICIATIRVKFCNAQLHSSNYRGYPNECTFRGISSLLAGVKSYSTVPLGIRSSPSVRNLVMVFGDLYTV